MPDVERVRSRQGTGRIALTRRKRDGPSVKGEYRARSAKAPLSTRHAHAVPDDQASAGTPALADFVLGVRIDVPHLLARQVVSSRAEQLIAREANRVEIVRGTRDRHE